MIYAVQILDQKFVKIGFTEADSTKRRISELQTASPFEITELFTVPGNIQQEQRLHSCLKDAFITVRIPVPPNEWYPGRNPLFREFLQAMSLGADQAIVYLISRSEDRDGKPQSFKNGRDGLYEQRSKFPRGLHGTAR